MEPLKDIAALVPLDRPPAQTAIVRLGPSDALVAQEREQFNHLVARCTTTTRIRNSATKPFEDHFDLERLAVIHGIETLKVALLNLQIKPGRKFFPHPSEVAEEIEQRTKQGRQ